MDDESLKSQRLLFIKPTWLIIIFFVFINIIINVTADPGSREPGRYSKLDLKYDLENYELTLPSSPSYPYTLWPPGFHFFLKAFMWIFNGPCFYIVTITQIGFLLIIGLVLRYLVERVLTGYGNIALLFMIFNPNSLATANLVAAENLHALTVFGAFAGVLLFVYKPRIWPAIVCGFSLGLSCWARPVTQYLVLMLPFVFPLLALVSIHKFRFFRDVGAGFLAMLIAVLIMLPWLLYMQKAGEGFRMQSHGSEYTFLKDIISYIEKEQLKNEGDDFVVKTKEELEQKYNNWEELSPVQRNILKTEYAYEYIYKHQFN